MLRTFGDEMKKLFLTLGVIGLIFVGALSVPIFIGYLQYRSAEPPPEVKSLQTFRTHMDDGSYDYFSFASQEGSHFEARKLLPFWFTFRSGWACYVFDTDGRFLDWTTDNGEDREWDLRWGQIGRGRMDVQDIEEAIQKSKRKPAPNKSRDSTS